MQNSTAASSRVRQLRRALFGVLATAAVGLAGLEIARQWGEFRESAVQLRVRWDTLALSGLCVLVAYAVLIDTWRRVVGAWGSRIGVGAATRIWFVSNLGRYLPGKVWQIGAMAVLAQQHGVPAVAATGSAIVVNLVNLLAGFGIVMLTGASLFDEPAVSWGLAAALALAIAVTPKLLPTFARVAATVLRRPVDVPSLPASAIWLAAVGCSLAWVLYGVAFQLLAASVLGTVTGPVSAYIAAFTGSYLLGYIALFSPGGLGVREGSLLIALDRLQLASAGAAGVLALTSRLWLTVLEVLPGLCLLAYDAVRRSSRDTPSR
ncbi:MAG: lysylphosphatidylglycerol synthase domain-containing protein [Gemmatimonadaceae bacterium]